MRYRLIHVSDLHAGPPFDPRAAERLAQITHELAPDLLVISGDLVQRADFPNQWWEILACIATLPQPRLIVPGNHDVPLFNFARRLISPLSIYRHYISPDVNPVFQRPGLVVAGASSAQGRTVDGGWLGAAQMAALERAFAPHGPATCKVAVWHHPLVMPPGAARNRTLENAPEAARLLDRLGVDILLCGHLHTTFISSTRSIMPGLERGTITCQSGTSSSTRGHGDEHYQNSFNMIDLDDETITITTFRAQNGGPFVHATTHRFVRDANLTPL